MAENSYAQLIDDFEKGINVLKGETLTEYIKRMGGVDYESKADGGAIGIEVLFGPKRKNFKKGGKGRQDRMGGTMEQTAAELREAAPDQFAGGMNISHGGGNGGTGGNNNLVDTNPNKIKDAVNRGILNLGIKKLGISKYINPALAIKGVYDYFQNPEIEEEDMILSGNKDGGRIGFKSGELVEGEVVEEKSEGNNILMEIAKVLFRLTPPGSFLFAADRAMDMYQKLDDEDKQKVQDIGKSALKFAGLPGLAVSGGMSAKSLYDKFKGNEMAQGGRVGLENGGTSNWWDGLTGEAKGIYDSMTAYGASDAEIQAKLQAQNLWNPDGTTTDTEQVTGIINQNIGGGDGDYQGGGKFGNLDLSDTKTFTKDVWSDTAGPPGQFDWTPTEVTGYMNPKTGQYQTFEGKNINHAGINFKPGLIAIAEALGFGDKIDVDEYGGIRPGSIKGTFTDGFTNPFGSLFQKQATIDQINAMNLKAIKDMEAKKAEEEAAKRAATEKRIISGGPNIQGDDGGNRFTTSSGDTYAAGDYTAVKGSLADPREKIDYYRDGGVASMFTRRR
tara:strand:- start:1944 stop:3620 length:1677 start_codon:yes stop_codon:yes gene_type:complete